MILNTAILKHPLNWIIVFLMVFIGVMVLNLVLTPWHIMQKGNSISANSRPSPNLATMQ